MQKVMMAVAFLGLVLIGGSAMMAIDAYATNGRKAAFHNAVDTVVNTEADAYAQRREDGCIRRCGFLGTLAYSYTSLRDGLFLSSGFNPQTALPDAPSGWTAAPYTLAAVERIVGATYERTPLSTTTTNALLSSFDKVAQLSRSGSVRVYTQGDKGIALSVEFSTKALRAAKDGKIAVAPFVEDPFAMLGRFPVRRHPQYSTVQHQQEPVSVNYSRFTIDFDAIVTVQILAMATDDDVRDLLAAFDITPIVEALPLVHAAK